MLIVFASWHDCEMKEYVELQIGSPFSFDFASHSQDKIDMALLVIALLPLALFVMKVEKSCLYSILCDGICLLNAS